MKGEQIKKIKRRRLSAKERKQIFDKYNGHCAYCGCEITFRGMQVDHKKALRTGGEDTIENMFPSCRSCNHYKSTLDVEEFREYLSEIHKRLMRDSVAFQVASRFGIVKHVADEVTFYFEKVEAGNETIL